MQEEQGGAGVYNSDLRKLYDLKDPAWRYDIMPEIVDGHNLSRGGLGCGMVVCVGG